MILLITELLCFIKGAFLTGRYPLNATQSAFYNNILYHVVHQNKFYLIFILSYGCSLNIYYYNCQISLLLTREALT